MVPRPNALPDITKSLYALLSMPDYKFPSGDHSPFSMTEIEGRYLRRKKKKSDSLAFTLGILLVVLLGLVFVEYVYPTFNAEAMTNVPETVIVDGVGYGKTSFCNQAVRDHETIGREITGDLKDYCGL